MPKLLARMFARSALRRYDPDMERWLAAAGWSPICGATRAGTWNHPKYGCYALAKAVRLQSNLDHRRRSIVLHCLYLTVIAVLTLSLTIF